MHFCCSSLLRCCAGGVLVLLLACWPMAQAQAQETVTLGFVPAAAELLETEAQAELLGGYLESVLDFKVKVRSFTREELLHQWLSRFREVDISVFSDGYIAGLPAGEVFTLAAAEAASGRRVQGVLVSRQGLDAVLLQRLRTSLFAMDQSAAGQAALASLGLTRFVPVSADLTPSRPEPSAAPTAPVVAEPAAVPNQPLPAPAEPLPVAAVEPLKPDAEPPVTVAAPAVPVPAESLPPATLPAAVAVPAPAADLAVADSAEAVNLAADSLVYNETDATYEALGHVVISRGPSRLMADQVLWQASTQDAAAEGDVRLEDPQGVMSGTSMQYNLATGQGQLRGGRVHLRERNFHLIGDDIEKFGEASYRIEGGSFTTCDGEVPDWKFTAEQMDVTLGRYLTARNVWFHVRDVPLAYVPYLVYPVKTDRASGFLSPWFGYSRSKGVRTSLAWYQVLDRNQDATLYLDYLSKLGVGKGLEYRYFFGKDSTGRAFYHHVSGISDNPDMFRLQWEHGGTLPGDIWLSADVDYVDDKTYFEEFGEVAEEYNEDKAVSTIWAQRNWDKLNAVGMLRYIKDLDQDNDATLQRLPEFSLDLIPTRIATTPLYASLESYATNFWREEGEEGRRLFLRPSLAAALQPGSWLELTPEVALYERLYRVGSRDEEMAIPEFSVKLATRLEKVYTTDFAGADKLQHSIEPEVRYVYRPDSAEQDLPEFDLKDRLADHNLIEYALINRLTARLLDPAGERKYRELAWLRLSQLYDVGEARDDHSDGPRQPFSDLRTELKLRPTESSHISLDSLIPVYGDTQFRKLKLGVGLDDNQGNQVNLNYNYRNAKLVADGNDYLGLTLDTALLQPVYLHYEERYDFMRRQELEKFVGLEYRSRCWSIVLTYRERYRSGEPDEQEVMVNFVLAGLSKNERQGSRAFASH